MMKSLFKPALTAVLCAAAAFLSCDHAGVRLFPTSGAEGVNVDTHLILTFDEAPAVPTAGWIRIFDAETGACVDSLDRGSMGCRIRGSVSMGFSIL